MLLYVFKTDLVQYLTNLDGHSEYIYESASHLTDEKGSFDELQLG